MDEASGCCGDCVAVFQTGRFHGCGFSPDTVLLGIKEQCDCPSFQEGLVRGVSRNDPILVVELHILEAELDRASVGCVLCVFARSQAVEKANLNQVCSILCLG